MKTFISKNHRLVFYLLWLFLGLLQSGLTELQDDEAYYWVFSKYPDLGYFDHPPMIAFLVKLGYSVFPNELGIRLIPLLLSIFSLVLIEKLIDRKNPFLFYAIALSVATFQLTGFMAVPDTPLVFFTALFFLFYKKFTENPSWLHTLLLGISIALLFYTKYHGLLVVVFAFLFNPRLFAKPQLYLAGLIALILFTPHLYWQWQHHWVSFRYHLFESNVEPYKISYTLNYIGGQILFAGPFVFFILFPAAVLYKPRSLVERSLKGTLFGIYLFFLLSSFRGKVEPNWTGPVLVPLVILGHQYLLGKPGLTKWLLRLLPFTLVLIAFTRIVMIIDILPFPAIKKRFHGWKGWPTEMKRRTRGLPVIFSNSYQRASKYWFYTGQKTYSQNHVMGRRNNFNFLPLEDELLGKPGYFLDIYNMERYEDSIKTPLGYVGYRYDSFLLSFAKISFEPEKKSYTIRENQPVKIKGVARMSDHYRSYIVSHPAIKTQIKLYFFKRKKVVGQLVVPLTLQEALKSSFAVQVVPVLPPGDYYFRFTIQVPKYNPTHNSDKIGLTIK